MNRKWLKQKKQKNGIIEKLKDDNVYLLNNMNDNLHDKLPEKNIYDGKRMM